VFSLKKHFWLVRDQALGGGKHKLDLFWHLSPGFVSGETDNGLFRSQEADFYVVDAQNHGWSKEILAEHGSPVYGRKENHNVVHFSTEANLPSEFATVLLPQTRIDTGVTSFQLMDIPVGGHVTCCSLVIAGGQHWFFFGKGKPWTLLNLSSDAEFLYWGQTEDRRRRMLICCKASYVEAGGQKVISSPQSFSRCEITRSPGEAYVVSSDLAFVVNGEAFDLILLKEESKKGPNLSTRDRT